MEEYSCRAGSPTNQGGGLWWNMEQAWAAKLKENPPVKVYVEITPIFNGNELRPTKFEVKYKYDGTWQTDLNNPNYKPEILNP